jgi:hypothetical protein
LCLSSPFPSVFLGFLFSSIFTSSFLTSFVNLASFYRSYFSFFCLFQMRIMSANYSLRFSPSHLMLL